MRHLSRQVGLALLSTIHSVVQLLLDPDLEVGIILSDFEELHVPLYGLNVERMSILKDDVVIGFISLDHQVVRVLD